jgi:tellurite resistance protein TerA
MLDTTRLPDSIHKLVFAVAMRGEATLQKMTSSWMRLGTAMFAFSGADFQDEKAMIIGEIYKRSGEWRFGAVGQGFKGGLSVLLQPFGGSAMDFAPAAPAPKKISLSKVTLEKRGDKISLEKNNTQGFGRIHVNLNWSQAPIPLHDPKKQGFFNKLLGGAPASSTIDLDLGCMFQMADGRTGCVQALGNSWGRFNDVPFIQLDGDDRSGTNSNGENIFINGDAFNAIKRILIFTFIYDGVPNWSATNGVVTIKAPNQATVEVKLDNGTDASMCAIAMIENNAGNFHITKLVEYFREQGNKSTHELMNDRFGFGLKFKAGSKD